MNWTEGGRSPFFHVVWAPTWPPERCWQYVSPFDPNSSLFSMAEKCRRWCRAIWPDKAPPSVRDQIFDHKFSAVRYYLDQEVPLETKVCYLWRHSNEVVQKAVRLASLTANTSAPTDLSSEQKTNLNHHPTVIRLSQKNKALTFRIHAAGYKPISAARGTSLFERKKKAKARLNCFRARLWSDLIEKARKQYSRLRLSIFRHRGCSDILTRHTVCKADWIPPSRASCGGSIYVQAGRASSPSGSELLKSEPHCHRQETWRRCWPESRIKQEKSDACPGDLEEDTKDCFHFVCKPTQCIFCLGNEPKPYRERI